MRRFGGLAVVVVTLVGPQPCLAHGFQRVTLSRLNRTRRKDGEDEDSSPL